MEWAVAWSPAGFGEADGFLQSYCNTVPTPEGGTHEAGLRAVLARGLKAYAELAGDKRGALITAEDVIGGAGGADLGLHPRAGVPGPDQGAPVLCRRPEAGGKAPCATPSTTG